MYSGGLEKGGLEKLFGKQQHLFTLRGTRITCTVCIYSSIDHWPVNIYRYNKNITFSEIYVDIILQGCFYDFNVFIIFNLLVILLNVAVNVAVFTVNNVKKSK